MKPPTFKVFNHIVDELTMLSREERGEIFRTLELLYCNCGVMRSTRTITRLSISRTTCEHEKIPDEITARLLWLEEREAADKQAALLVRTSFV